MQNTKLTFDDWAKKWEEALPLGNGSLGAMVYGGASKECIQLNEDTLWSGKPLDDTGFQIKEHVIAARELIENGSYKEAENYVNSNMLGHWTQNYLPVGSISIDFGHEKEIEHYRRELDLINGIIKVSYTHQGTNYMREYFCSHVDDVLAVRITSEQKNSFDCSIGMDCLLKYDIEVLGNSIKLTGEAPVHVDPVYDSGDDPILYGEREKGIEFSAQLKIETDGVVNVINKTINIQQGSYVILYIASKTNYIDPFTTLSTEKKNPTVLCHTTVDKAMKKGYEVLKGGHIKDFSERMERVTLTFDGGEENITTKNRILKMQDKEEFDPILVAQLFHFGRYLIISSSREGSQASNLQGIWNNMLQAPWCSNYTININTQMNYWPVDVTNLSECYEPLITMIKELAQSGIVAAKALGCRGWTANHNTDLWRQTIPVSGEAMYAFWPFGGPWLTTHLYEHYCYTGDSNYLKEVYPIIKGSAIFCLDWSYVDKEGYLVTAPSTSPENNYNIKDGTCCITKASTMDISIIWQVFTDCIACIDELDIEQDHMLKKELIEAKGRLYPYHMNSKGQIGEWWDDPEDCDLGHRHVSHLWGLYPGHRVNCDEDKTLLAAHAKSLENRIANGGGHTSWSCAWVMLLYARLRDKKRTKDMMMKYFKNSLITNGFSSHPPFQIDGNFGYTAAISEMLIQSHNDYIEILPALPHDFHRGSFSGLKVRGGYEISAEWKNGIITKVEIISNKDKEITLNANNQKKTIQCLKNEKVIINL